MNETRKCQCGCTAEVGPKANYRPGHDAAHVAKVANYTAWALADARSYPTLGITYLPSEKLQAKAIAQAARKYAANPDTATETVEDAIGLIERRLTRDHG